MQSEHSGARRALVTGLGAAALAASFAGDDAIAATPAVSLTKAIQGALPAMPMPPLSVRALHRLGYGPARRKLKPVKTPLPGTVFSSDFETAGDIGEDDVGYFESLGGTDDERLTKYVDEQLAPALIADPTINTILATYPGSFAVTNQTLQQAYSTRACRSFDEYVRPFREIEKLTITRAVHSRRQLLELTVDFWHNHFNVYAPLSNHTYASWHSWDRDIIRAHAFGNFYTFLYASAKHVTMLRYLDNYRSSVRFNENYAREVIELHTLGAENYRGLGLATSIPALAVNPYLGLNDAELDNASLSGGIAISARPIAEAYIDSDVYEAARTLSGWRYARTETPTTCDTAAFYTEESNHSAGAKSLLSRGQQSHTADLDAEQDGRITLKMLAYHPGTARHIARKLCQRLISDDPPQSVVDAAYETFYANRLAGDQIAKTIRTIVLSPEFKDPALWGSKIKRPFELVASAMRAAGCSHAFREDDPTNTTNDFVNVYSATGHRLFLWRSPDGYPDNREHWQGSNTMVQNWRVIDWLMDRDAMDDTKRVMRVLDYTLANIAGDPTARQIVEFWIQWIMGFKPPAGSWTGPVGTAYNDAPTELGKRAMQFFLQSGYGADRDRNVWTPDDDHIPRAKLSVNADFEDWNVRLRGLVSLILWSPNFAQR